MNWKENWPYYRKRILIVLNILVIVFGLIGTFEYYRPRIDADWRLVTAMLYGTFKLYFLSPTISIEAEITPLYEIAKWIAPFLTSAMVLTILGNAFHAGRNRVLYRFGEKSILIGDTEETRLFARNLSKQRDTRVLLYTETAQDTPRAKSYGEDGVALSTHDWRQPPDRETRAQVRSARFNTAKNLLLFYADDLDNYAVFTTLLKVLAPKKPIQVRVRCQSETLRELMRSMLAEAARENEALRYLDVRYFDVAELVAESLLQREDAPLYQVPLARLQGLEPESAAQISDACGTTHVLHFGFNAIAVWLTRKMISAGTVSLSEKIHVTIVDRDAEGKLDAFLAAHPEMEQGMEFHTISLDVRSRAMQNALTELSRTEAPVTWVCCNFEDVLLNLHALALVRSHSVPKAVRNTTAKELGPVFQSGYPGEPVFSYGQLPQVLTPSILINETLDRQAVEHNRTYNQTSEAFGNGPGSAWEDLSFVKKDSSRAAALHGRWKAEVLRTLFAKGDADDTLKQQRAYLAEVFSEKRPHEEANRALLSVLDTYPALDYLTQLEHLRWCRFYYGLNFRYGETKDEQQKTHPCLVEAWEEIAGPLANVCYPVFDAISVLALENIDEETYGNKEV